jgi:hypothetical protein
MIAEHLAPDISFNCSGLGLVTGWPEALCRSNAWTALRLTLTAALDPARAKVRSFYLLSTSIAYSEYRAFQFRASTAFLRLPEISSDIAFVQPFCLLKT